MKGKLPSRSYGAFLGLLTARISKAFQNPQKANPYSPRGVTQTYRSHIQKFSTVALMLLIGGNSLFAQSTCSDNLTASGNDSDPVVVEFTSFPCTGGGTITAMDLTTNSTSSFCPTWYDYIIEVTHSGGTESLSAQCNVTNLDLATFNSASINVASITSVKITSNDPDSWSDAVTVDATVNVTYTAPACPIPTALGVSNVTTTSADLGWTAGGSETQWDIEWGAGGFTPGTGTVISGATLNPHSLSGLTTFTTYDFYVRADCGGSGTSLWVGPYQFTTSAPNLTLPYANDFEASLTDLVNDAGNQDMWMIDTAKSSGTSSVKNSYSANADNILLLPNPIDLSLYSNALLSFDHIAKTEGTYDYGYVEYSADNGATWQAIPAANYLGASSDYSTEVAFHEDSYGQWGTGTTTPTNTWWKTESFNLAGLGSGTVMIRFRLNADGSAQREGWYIDNLTITNPSCIAPTLLGVDNMTPTTADLYWTTGGASDWNLEYGTTGFSLGSGTMINTTNDTVSITGLSANTTYDFYVRDSCGVGSVSGYAGPFTFTTPCVAVVAPWTEDFENGGSIPLCWNQGASNQKDWEFRNTGTGHIGSNGTLGGSTNSGNYFAWLDDSSPHELGTTLESPMIDVSSLTQPLLRFFLISDNEGNTNVDFSVEVWDGAAWNVMYTSSSNTVNGEWEEISVDLSSLSITGDIQLRFIVDENNGTDFYDDVAIDDISVIETPSCAVPTALGVTALTSTSADVYWITGGASNWNVQYGLQGFTPGTGTIINATNDTTSLSGLSANTTYEFYVRDSCGVGDVSAWAGPFAFTTPCAASLSGAYTIDANQATAGTNFASFAEAASTVSACGVSGPVTFTVAAGTYTDTMYLGAIAGASAVNMITFDGVDTAIVNLVWGATTQPSVILMDGADFVNITNIKITHPGTTDAWGIRLQNDNDNVSITNCMFEMQPSSSTSDDVQAIVGSGSATNDFSETDFGDNLTITGNTFHNGVIAVHLESSSYADSGTVISNNIIRNSYYRSIMTDNTYDITIEENDIEGGSYSSHYGIALYDAVGYEINRNMVMSPDIGLFLSDGNFDDKPTSFSNITNNMVWSTGDEAGDMDDMEWTNVYYNTFVTTASSSSAYGAYFNDLDSVYIKNNIFYSLDGYALYSSDAGFTNTNVEVDYNLYHTVNGSSLVYEGSAVADLATWQTSSPAYNQNSVSGNPLFTNLVSGDLHLVGALANNAGTPIAGITVDIDADPRSATTPDIGADEFTPASCLFSTNLMVSMIGPDSALVSWTSGGASTFNLEYGINGYTQGTGTLVTNITDTFYVITGLSSATAYDFYVQDSCGVADVSLFAGPGSFITSCTPFTAPYSQNFDGAPAQDPFGGIACWSVVGPGANDIELNDSPDAGIDPAPSLPNSVELNDGDFDGGDTAILVSPAFSDLSSGLNRIRFKAAFEDTDEELFVGVMTDPLVASSLVILDTIQTSTVDTYIEYTINLDNTAAIGSAEHIAFVHGTDVWEVYIDDFVYEAAPVCPPFTAPYMENFDASALPNCWTEYAGNGGPWEFTGSTNSVNCAAAADHTGNSGSYAWVDQSSADSAVVLEMNDVDVGALTTPYLQFYYWLCGVGYTPPNPLYIETWDGSTWVLADSVVQSTNGWQKFGFDMTGYTYGANLLKVRFRVESGGSSDDFYGDNAIDDVSIMEAPTCFDPTNLMVSGVTNTTAQISWTTGGASNWLVELNDGATTTLIPATNDTITLTGLSAASSYTVRVKDSCGVGDVSDYSLPVSFWTIACDTADQCTFSADLFDSFGDGWNGAEISMYQNGGIAATLGGTFATGGSLLGQSFGLCDSTMTYVILTDAGGFPDEISFDIFTPANLLLASHAAQTGLSTGDTLASFMTQCAAPSCIPPTAVGAFQITDTSAAIYFTSGGSANWNIQYDTTGFALGTGTTVAVTNDTVVITGLMPNTTYDFYVQDSCAAGNVSAWAGPVTVTTECAEVPLPYTETFEIGSSTTLACVRAEANWALAAVGGFANSSNSIFFDFYNVTSGTFSAFTPRFAPTPANYQLSFDHAKASFGAEADSLEIYYSMDGGNTYTLLVGLDGSTSGVLNTAGTTASGFVPASASDWGTYTISLPVGVNRIRIDAISDYGNNLFIDNFSVEPLPSCLPPAALGVTNTTITSADIYWTAGGATDFNVEYGPYGFNLGSGTMVNTTNDTLSLSSLSPGTRYEFYVRDSCGLGSVSAWVGPFVFETSCVPVTSYPYIETFDGSASLLPVCYAATSISANGAYNWLPNSGGTTSGDTGPLVDHTQGTGSGVYVYTEASSPAATGDSAILELPEFDLTSLTNPEMVFWYHMYGADITYLSVQVWNTGTMTWDSIYGVSGQQQTANGDAWLEARINMSSYTSATNLQVRFLTVRGGSFNGDVALDDIEVRETPPCVDPTQLMVTSASTSSASLSWMSDTNVTASTVEYGPIGFTLGTGTQMGSMPQMATITGLSPATCYDFYVLDSCGSGTNWVGPVSVCTQGLCTVTGVPTNVMNDTTACGGGSVTLSASSSGANDLAWISNGEVISTGNTFVSDSLAFTTTFQVAEYTQAAPSQHVGPLPSIAAAGFGNFSNGQFITVTDTIFIDSTTVRANGYVNAQVWVTDPGFTRVIQAGEVFETDSNVTANYQVPVGILLTPGNYLIGVNFDVTATSTGALFRATGGAAYPYSLPGLMSITGTNFSDQARYYYTFDLVVAPACIGTTVPAIGFVPGANAGATVTDTACGDQTVDLASLIGPHDFGGTWYDDDNTGVLTDSIFDAAAAGAGTYQFTYGVPASSGCPGGDSAVVTLTVEAPPFAGVDTSAAICATAGSVLLRTYITGNKFAGTYTDLDNSGALNNGLFNPTNVPAGMYRFLYVVPGQNRCAPDSAVISLTVDESAIAGGDVMDTICDSARAVDLTLYLDANASPGGTWVDVSGSGGLTGTFFDPGSVNDGQTYVFRYVVDNACGMDSSEVSIYVEDCEVGLGEYTTAVMEVYPNPTTGRVLIDYTAQGTTDMQVEVLSMNGKVLQMLNFSKTEEAELDISKLADGMYNIRITTGEAVEVHRIVKQ